MIGQKFNFDEVFFRDLTVCVLDTLEGRLNWINRFSSGNISVSVPIYYSMTGDDRFLLDSFQDDIVSNNRYVELNTDQIPRGHLTLSNFNIRSDEFRNPNVWLRTVVEDDVEVKKLLKRVKAIPISVTYDLTILLKNEIDVFKCAQEIMNTLWLYRFMYFEHNYMHIDAFMLMPDTETIQIQREKNLKSDDSVKLTASIEVQTYYPTFVDPKQVKVVTKVIKSNCQSSIKLDSVDGISIGDYIFGSAATYNISVLSILSDNIVLLSDKINLSIGQVVSFGIDAENFDFNSITNEYTIIDIYPGPIKLNSISGISVGDLLKTPQMVLLDDISVIAIVDNNSIIVNKSVNIKYNQIVTINDTNYTTYSGCDVVYLNTVKNLEVGQFISGDNISGSLKVLDINESESFIVTNSCVCVISGQELIITSDYGSNAIVPYRTRWFNNLHSGRIKRVNSSNPYSSLNNNPLRFRSNEN